MLSERSDCRFMIGLLALIGGLDQMGSAVDGVVGTLVDGVGRIDWIDRGG